MNPVAPYAGQSQTSQINVPAPIAYKYIDREEGCWAMLPYSSLYPPDSQAQPPATQLVPPPIYKTDLWTAMQTWPM